MAEFLVELYVARSDDEAVTAAVTRACAAADALRESGAAVRYVSSIFVPEDETCFLLFEAPSAAAVRELAGRAALLCERIAEARATTAAVKR